MPSTAKPNVGPNKRPDLRPDEARRLIDAAGKRGRHPLRDRTLLRMLYLHAMRPLEALLLRWASVDFDAGTITLQGAKGGKTSIHRLDQDDLRDLRELRGLCKQQADTREHSVFETERGGQMSSDMLPHIVREAGKRAQLDIDVSPSMFRRLAARELLNSGLDARQVQHFLGHAAIDSTVRYASPEPDRVSEVRRGRLRRQ